MTEKDVIRHYDITGKICPKYFVEDEAAWEKFREDVKIVLAKCKRVQLGLFLSCAVNLLISKDNSFYL